MASETKSEVKVVDRRKFNLDGSLRDDLHEPEPEPVKTKPIEKVETPKQSAPKHDPPTTPETDTAFLSLVSSLATSARMALGDIPDSSLGISSPNPEEARNVIDLLDSLHTKTMGNLSPDEDRILKSVLYELKVRFVSANEHASKH